MNTKVYRLTLRENDNLRERIERILVEHYHAQPVQNAEEPTWECHLTTAEWKEIVILYSPVLRIVPVD
jgi:hypothetical protein